MPKSNKGSEGKKARSRRTRLLTKMAERLGVSPQRAWQMVRQVMGLCQKCGKKANEGALCKFHAEYERNRDRSKKVTA